MQGAVDEFTAKGVVNRSPLWILWVSLFIVAKEGGCLQ